MSAEGGCFSRIRLNNAQENAQRDLPTAAMIAFLFCVRVCVYTYKSTGNVPILFGSLYTLYTFLKFIYIYIYNITKNLAVD